MFLSHPLGGMRARGEHWSTTTLDKEVDPIVGWVQAALGNKKMRPRKFAWRQSGKEGGHGKPKPAISAPQLFRVGCGWGAGTPLYRQCGGYDRGSMVGAGLCPGRGCGVQEGHRRLRKGERQHDRPEHHAIRADA